MGGRCRRPRVELFRGVRRESLFEMRELGKTQAWSEHVVMAYRYTKWWGTSELRRITCSSHFFTALRAAGSWVSRCTQPPLRHSSEGEAITLAVIDIVLEPEHSSFIYRDWTGTGRTSPVVRQTTKRFVICRRLGPQL